MTKLSRKELIISKDEEHNEYAHSDRTHTFNCYSCKDIFRQEKLIFKKVTQLVKEHKDIHKEKFNYLVTVDYTKMDLVERQLEIIEELTGVHLEVENKTIYGEGFARYALVKDRSDRGIAYCYGIKELMETVSTLQDFAWRIDAQKKQEVNTE